MNVFSDPGKVQRPLHWLQHCHNNTTPVHRIAAVPVQHFVPVK